MRRTVVSWLLILTLVITLIPATVATSSAASYYSYEGVKYSIVSGVLTIEKGEATDDCPAGSMGDSKMYSYKGWKSRSSEITKVVIKDGVTDIVEQAFSGMPNLVEADIAGSVKTIGLQAFAENTALTTVKLGDGVETIGQEAFLQCSGLTEISMPSSVKTIGQAAFSGCENLADVELPESLRWVGINAFTGTAIVNAQSGNDFVIVDSALIKSNKTEFSADDPCVIPEGITCVADEAFLDVEIKGSLTFPDSLLYIGNYSFDGGHYNLTLCDKPLTELDFNNVVQVGNGSFRYWYCIDEVDLSKVTYVGDNAFYWCHDLAKITLPAKMEYLGNSVFEASGNMAEVNGPEYVERVYAYSLWSDSPIGNEIYGDTDGDGMIYYNNALLLVNTDSNEITVAEGTYTIASEAFNWYSPADSTTVSLTIPKSVVSIGDSYTFYNVTDVYYAGSMKDWNAINFEDATCFSDAIIHCAESNAVSVEDCTVKVEYTATTYAGVAKTPKVTVTDPDGKTLVQGTDYKVNYTNNVNAGTATVTVTGQGEYEGTVERTFIISKVAADKVMVKLAQQKYNYNGKQREPGVTLTDASGRVLVKDTDYTVTYPKTLGAGRYKVTVTLKGNYTGTKTAWFTIVPAATSTVWARLYNPTKVIVKWDLVPQASGYYLYYKKANSSTWSKAIDCGKTRTYTKTGLAAGTQYSFKVVAYWKANNGTKYTSNAFRQSNIYTLKKAGPVTVKKYAAAKAKVTWKNINGESGYQIQKMKKVGKSYVAVKTYKKKANTTNIVIPHAKGKQFFYRVRPYKTEVTNKTTGATKTVYGNWTVVKGIKL